jgi:hypothetical protein
MKFVKILALAALISVSVTACLKDKSAEQKTEETTVEQTVDQTAPAEGQPTEAPAQPADAGTTAQ